jgi:hypothetical protein
MEWQELERLVQVEIRPVISAILKCNGVERRVVTSNNGEKVGMRTGVQSATSKAITYKMIHFAFNTMRAKGRFQSSDFREEFGAEYDAAPCRYSMTGGVLVEVGMARLVPSANESSCYYVPK